MAQIVNVFLEGPGPFGFRLLGGRGDPLIISKIRVGSKAFEADLREGDVVKSLNGQDCAELTQSAAMNIVDNAEGSLSLDIVRNDRAGPGTVVSKHTQKSVQSVISAQRPAPKASSDFVDYRQLNSHPNEAHRGYNRQEQTSRDGNTTNRTVTETEKYGGTTLTRVTRERTSEWNNVGGGEPWRPSSTTPREEVFRTTSAGFRPDDKVPTNPDDLEMTLDLGQPESKNFGSNYNLLTSESRSSRKPGAWTLGRDSSPWEEDQGRLTVDVFSDRSIPRSQSATHSPHTGGRQSVWTPSRHEPSPLTYDIDNKKFEISFPSNSASYNQNGSNNWSSSKQLGDDGFNSESILFKWNSGGQQMQQSPLGRREEVFRTTSAKVKREPTPVTFDIDLGKPSWEDSKENYAPSLKYQPSAAQSNNKPWSSSANQIPPMSWEFDLSHSNDSKLTSSSQQNSLFSVNKATKPGDTSTWKPSNVSSTPQRRTDYPSSGSQFSPRMSKFDSDKGFVDPLSLDDLDALGYGLDSHRDPPNKSADRRLNFPDLPPDINKILSAPRDVVEDPAALVSRQRIRDDGTMEEKKVYGDSAFYGGSKHNYPTVEEQVKMARIVAHSLTSDANANARGHQMFLKRKERADKYTVDSKNDVKKSNHVAECSMDDDPYYNPTPWRPAKSWQPDSFDAGYGSSIPPPPPLPTSLLFAPRGEDKSKALSAEEFERVRLYDQKTKHDTVSPQVCFNLARDLRENKGKGGRMFAKRRARAEQYTVEGQGHGPDTSVMMKLVSSHSRDNPAPRSDHDISSLSSNPRPVDNIDYTNAPPVNRLQQMIELTKPKMTPWDAMAEYGHIDPAFEHLKDISFIPKKQGAEVLTSSIHSKMRSDYDSTLAPTGPPSWARSTNSSINTDFSSRSNTSAVFTPKVDFNGKSSSGYRPVQFSGSIPNHYGNTSSLGFSEF